MIRPALLAVALLLIGGLSGVAQDGAPAVPADSYARVGSATITRAQVKAEAQVGTPAQTLQRLIQIEFLRQNLERDGVDVGAMSDEQFQAGLAEAHQQLAKNGAKLDALLKASGQTRAQFEAGFRYSVAMTALIRSRVNEAQLRTLYGAQRLRLGGELRASHVFVAISKTRTPEAARARAQKLLEDLKAVDAKGLAQAFADLAAAESDDGMGALNGGDLDWFKANARGPVPIPVVMGAYAHGEPGLVPDPIRSRNGWHVLLVTEVKLPESVTFESLRPKLAEQAEAEEARKLLTRWRERTPIHYAPDAPGKPSGQAGGFR